MLKKSNIHWNDIQDIAEVKMGMHRRTCAGAVNVLKHFGGMAFEMPCPEGIRNIDTAIKAMLVETMGKELNVSTSTLRHHGLLKMSVINGIGYAIFTTYAIGVRRANMDRAAYDGAPIYNK